MWLLEGVKGWRVRSYFHLFIILISSCPVFDVLFGVRASLRFGVVRVVDAPFNVPFRKGSSTGVTCQMRRCISQSYQSAHGHMHCPSLAQPHHDFLRSWEFAPRAFFGFTTRSVAARLKGFTKSLSRHILRLNFLPLRHSGRNHHRRDRELPSSQPPSTVLDREQPDDTTTGPPPPS